MPAAKTSHSSDLPRWFPLQLAHRLSSQGRTVIPRATSPHVQVQIRTADVKNLWQLTLASNLGEAVALDRLHVVGRSEYGMTLASSEPATANKPIRRALRHTLSSGAGNVHPSLLGTAARRYNQWDHSELAHGPSVQRALQQSWGISQRPYEGRCYFLGMGLTESEVRPAYLALLDQLHSTIDGLGYLHKPPAGTVFRAVMEPYDREVHPSTAYYQPDAFHLEGEAGLSRCLTSRRGGLFFSVYRSSPMVLTGEAGSTILDGDKTYIEEDAAHAELRHWLFEMGISPGRLAQHEQASMALRKCYLEIPDDLQFLVSNARGTERGLDWMARHRTTTLLEWLSYDATGHVGSCCFMYHLAVGLQKRRITDLEQILNFEKRIWDLLQEEPLRPGQRTSQLFQSALGDWLHFRLPDDLRHHPNFMLDIGEIFPNVDVEFLQRTVQKEGRFDESDWRQAAIAQYRWALSRGGVPRSGRLDTPFEARDFVALCEAKFPLLVRRRADLLRERKEFYPDSNPIFEHLLESSPEVSSSSVQDLEQRLMASPFSFVSQAGKCYPSYIAYLCDPLRYWPLLEGC